LLVEVDSALEKWQFFRADWFWDGNIREFRLLGVLAP
jgi:hypothetical protein